MNFSYRKLMEIGIMDKEFTSLMPSFNRQPAISFVIKSCRIIMAITLKGEQVKKGKKLQMTKIQNTLMYVNKFHILDTAKAVIRTFFTHLRFVTLRCGPRLNNIQVMNDPLPYTDL